MKTRRAIVDTQALVYLARMECQYPVWDELGLYFDKLLVPMQVVAEFNCKIEKYPANLSLARAIDSGGFFEKCDTFDLVNLTLFEGVKGVDPGEAEALAQQLAVQADFIWSDDKAFMAAVKKYLAGTCIFNTLHVTAFLDMSGCLSDYAAFVRAVHAAKIIKPGSFPSYYQEAGKHLGVNLTRAEAEVRTDFGLLGIV